MQIDSIQFGSKKIDFQWQYSQRKTLGITITPQMLVLVKAPLNVPIEKIKEKLRLRAVWILKQIQFFAAFHPKMPEKRYITGETHLYMGRQYRLKVITENIIGKENTVKLKGQFLEVYTADKENAQKLLTNWYLAKAQERFHTLAKPLFEKFVLKYNLPDAEYALSIRKMETRWGSCTPNGKIWLNPELIKAPKACIEYIIIHELCHLIHPNHSQQFMDLQLNEMPDWEKWKEKLEVLLA